MNSTLPTLTLADVRKHSPHLEGDAALGDDFLIAEINGENIDKSLATVDSVRDPIRFDGFICLYCLRGDFSIEVNMKTYQMTPKSIFINLPGNIVRVREPDASSLPEAKVIIIMASRAFMNNIRFDFNKSFQDSIRIMQTPLITLDDHQLEIAEDYLNLAIKIIHSSLTNRKDIIGSLISSLTYMSADIWESNLSAATELPAAPGTPDRLNILFDRFIALVGEYSSTYRNVGFYAEKLCLTPKYLSKLIKQTSGRSAPDWIDSFVILEAKNLLKYSDVSIKEIVYQLHFPNQSVFYKFFKTHTGITPSEYRKGINKKD